MRIRIRVWPPTRRRAPKADDAHSVMKLVLDADGKKESAVLTGLFRVMSKDNRLERANMAAQGHLIVQQLAEMGSEDLDD